MILDLGKSYLWRDRLGVRMNDYDIIVGPWTFWGAVHHPLLVFVSAELDGQCDSYDDEKKSKCSYTENRIDCLWWDYFGYIIVAILSCWYNFNKYIYCV